MDQRVLSVKRYFLLLKAQEIDSYHQMQFSVILWTSLFGGVYVTPLHDLEKIYTITLNTLIYSYVFKEDFMKLEYLAIKEKMFCVLSVIGLFTAK